MNFHQPNELGNQADGLVALQSSISSEKRMQTLRLTRIDFKPSKRYWLDYAGKTELLETEANIEIDANLGCVRFPKLHAKGSITALAGTALNVDEGIQAGGGIKSDLGISAGASIKAVKGIYSGGDIKSGGSIEAGWAIFAGEGIDAGRDIKASTGIRAGTGISAGGSIKAGAGISAGWRIKAGAKIEAGEGIEAGLAIECGGALFAKSRVFAGLCLWRSPTEEEKRIICSKFEGGNISYGTLVERG